MSLRYEGRRIGSGSGNGFAFTDNGGGLVVATSTFGRHHDTTPSGLLVPNGKIKEQGERRAPSHRLVLITDFSSAKGAKRDERSNNQVKNAFKKVCEANGVGYVQPLSEDGGAYALRPINAAYLTDLYGIEHADEQRVHVVVCDPGVGGDREGIVIKTKQGAYLVGPNNGLFWEQIKREGIATDLQGEPEVYKVKDERFKDVESATFHGKEVFAPVGAELASGKDPAHLTEWLERFDPEKLVKLDFEQNQILEIDGVNLVTINAKMPDDHPITARVIVTDRETGQTKVLEIPTGEKFVDGEKGQLIIYSGSDRHFLEIAACNAVHEHEDHAPKQLSVRYKDSPIEPGDILDIKWLYETELREGKGVSLRGKR